MIEVKRDDGFAVEIDLFQADDGVTPIVVTGATLLSQLRNRDALVSNLTVAAVSGVAAQNRVRVSAAAAVSRTWPLSDARNVLKFDVAVIAPGADPIRTGDFVVTVMDQQTERALP